MNKMPRGVRIPGQKIDKGTTKRLLGYVFKPYKFRCILVVVCILISAVAGVAGSLFLKQLIDDYIAPMLQQAVPDYTPLAGALLQMALIYLAGIIASFSYNRLMVKVSQGVLKTIRDDMFAHMQTLPVKYFDTHTHGDVMSHYTNDTDTLRQMISQSLPNLVSSSVTILAVCGAMLSLSPVLSFVVLVCVVLMLQVTKKIAGQRRGSVRKHLCERIGVV